jgi:hypothetical protein
MFAMNSLSFKKKIKDLYSQAEKAAKTNNEEAISLYNEIVSILAVKRANYELK